MCIESELHKRKGKAVNNFALTLPEPHSDLAVESLKDPYCLDFLTLSDKAQEKEIEQGLIDQGNFFPIFQKSSLLKTLEPNHKAIFIPKEHFHEISFSIKKNKKSS